MVVRYCDKCKKSIKSNDEFYFIVSRKFTPAARENVFKKSDLKPFAELCEDCYSTLLDMPVPEEPEEKDDETDVTDPDNNNTDTTEPDVTDPDTSDSTTTEPDEDDKETQEPDVQEP